MSHQVQIEDVDRDSLMEMLKYFSIMHERSLLCPSSPMYSIK